MHRMADAVAEAINIPFLHIADPTAQKGLKKLACSTRPLPWNRTSRSGGYRSEHHVVPWPLLGKRVRERPMPNDVRHETTGMRQNPSDTRILLHRAREDEVRCGSGSIAEKLNENPGVETASSLVVWCRFGCMKTMAFRRSNSAMSSLNYVSPRNLPQCFREGRRRRRAVFQVRGSPPGMRRR